MLFHASYLYASEDRDAVHERFRRTGGQPPAGVEMLGRWHAAAGNGGFLVAEADSAEAMAAWLQDWSDLVSFEVVPVLADAAFRDVIG